ncbi:hypothetical protein SK128_003838 [Halocaridina rubra]|uniref:C2H2-type domain-containing protein n=1 Tax=Halocaridina rubra TaxID=373956 RepID=A0AAN8XN11_HALRR
MDITTSGNLRSSSASSTSSSNIPSAVKTVKKARATNQEISHPHSRPKSPDGMINPSDFMDMDMTYVKEEVQSGGEDDEEEGEEESGGSEVTKTTSPKRFETQPQDTAPYPTISTSSQEDPASTPNGSSQDFGGSYVKMETESNSMSSLDSSKLQFETPQPFICPFCQENHRSIENIATHLRLNHPSKPNFVCRCGRVFTRNTYYQAHVKVCPSSSS